MYVCRTDDGIELRAMQDTCVQRLLGLGIWPEEVWPSQRFRERLIEASQMHARGKGLACAIYVNDEIAGYIILDIHGKKHGQLHYGLRPSHRGRGIATKSCAAAMEHAFQRLYLETIKVFVRVSNTRSCRVPERLGFRKAGTERLHDEDEDGPLIEVAEYVIAKQAWQRRRSGDN